MTHKHSDLQPEFRTGFQQLRDEVAAWPKGGITEFAQKVLTWREHVDPQKADAYVQAAVTKLTTDFATTFGVQPSRQQVEEKRTAAAAQYDADLREELAQLELVHDALESSVEHEVARAAEVPRALDRLYQAQRDARQVVGLSLTEETVVQLLEEQRTTRAEAELQRSTLAQLPDLYRRAVRQQEHELLRTIERAAVVGFPDVKRGSADDAGALLEVRQQIADARAARVPASLTAERQKLRQVWDNLTTQQHRCNMKQRKLGIAARS